MDAIDVGILRTMGVRPFSPDAPARRSLRSAAIARALDVSVQLVKDRVGRMEQDGVIVGYRLMPNLAHRGLRMASFHFSSERPLGPHDLERLCAVDGVSSALAFYGSQACFDMSHQGPTQVRRRLALVRSVLGGDATPRWAYDWPLPPVGRPLSTLDWRILGALRHNARRPASEVADEVGVSDKTVRTRVKRMRQEGAFDEYVALDFGRMRGVVPFMLYVWPKPGEGGVAVALRKAHGPRVLGHFHARGQDPGAFVMQMVASHPGEVQQLAHEAAARPDVAHAEAQLPTGARVEERWLAELFDGVAGHGVPETPVAPSGPEAAP